MRRNKWELGFLFWSIVEGTSATAGCLLLGDSTANNNNHVPRRKRNSYTNDSTTKADHIYIALYKPALMLCSFRNDEEECAQRNHRLQRSTLASVQDLPHGLHTCGRLDRDSEGLLLLTTDGAFTSRVCEPREAAEEEEDVASMTVPKRYLARVRNVPTADAMDQMRRGGLKIRGAVTRPPVSVQLLHEAHDLPHHLPPPVPSMQDRQGSYAWLDIVLTEGRNRQVRRITAAAGHETVRLVRVSVGNLSLTDLNLYRPGEWRTIDGKKAVLGGVQTG